MKKPIYRICVNWSTRGSHQGGPMYSYKEHYCMFSKSESTVDNLIKFLSKYTKTVKDKTKKKKGGNRSKTILGGKQHHHIKSRNQTKNKKKYRRRSSKSVKHLPKSKTYTYCEKINEDTPNKTKVCKQLCHSMSKKDIYTHLVHGRHIVKIDNGIHLIDINILLKN